MDEKQKVMIKWLENETKGKRWNTYFLTYDYKNITVYGAGDLGKLLIWELKDSEVKVNSVIDRRANEIVEYESLTVYGLDEFLESDIKTDAIVVTALNAYEEVLKKTAEKRIDLPVLFLRDMVYEL